MNLSEYTYQIFGSKSSIDLDVMVFIKSLGSDIDKNHEICKYFVILLKKELNTTKKINTNLAVLDGYNNKILDVFKGTIDEVNNSLYYTHNLHLDLQKYNNHISSLIERDVERKVLRTARVLLSFLSRTIHRQEVKKALKQDIYKKISTLKGIDLTTIIEDNILKRKVSYKDYLKIMSFQLAQTLALVDNIELYTKESIIEKYPLLKSFIQRDINSDLTILEDYKNEFCILCENFNFKSIYEY